MLETVQKSLHRITISQELMAFSFLLVIALAGSVLFLYFRLTALSNQVAQLNTELASTTTRLAGNLSDATTSLENALNQTKKNVQDQLGGVQDQVGNVAIRVTDLTKLSKTDPELLSKYSKVFFLSDTYTPVRLIDIPTNYKYNETSPLQIIPEVLPYLQKMIDQAKADGVALFVDSAYRSFNTQHALKGQYSFTYGAGTANSFSADQGYSEHQLGTTVDLITTGTGGALVGFDKTPAYTWLLANAYKYGFVISYPKNNGYYVFEPWHWRFVGVKLATDLHKSNSYFYTMDQRAIDTYLINLFD